ncbi:MAG: hypothetical protein WCQ64_06895 [Acidobacteriota bacterium]
MRTLFVVAALGVATASLTAASLQTPKATLKFDAPATWVSKAPSSSMRLAEFTLPKVDGDPEDATVTVFFFGATQGGNVQANIDRWVSQMAQPDGKASKDVAKTMNPTSTSGLKLTAVDVSGTFVAEVAPGSTEHFNKPGFRQLAVYVDTSGGPYFVKALGPAATITKWQPTFHAFLMSLKYE